MSLKNAIVKIKPAIFQIQLTQQQSSNLPFNSSLGTAFAISDDGILLTALHVISYGEEIIAKSNGQGKLHAAFAGESVDREDLKVMASFSGTEFDIIARDTQNDLALLKLKTGDLSNISIRVGGEDGPLTVPKSATILGNRPENGEAIAISGYPLGEPSLVTNAGHIANNWTIIPQMYECYLGDVTSNPGNSGGPVYRQNDAKVIGILTASKLTSVLDEIGQPTNMSQSASLAVIVPGYNILKFVEDNDIRLS